MASIRAGLVRQIRHLRFLAAVHLITAYCGEVRRGYYTIQLNLDSLAKNYGLRPGLLPTDITVNLRLGHLLLSRQRRVQRQRVAYCNKRLDKIVGHFEQLYNIRAAFMDAYQHQFSLKMF